MSTKKIDTNFFPFLSVMPMEVEKILSCFPDGKLNWKPNSWDGNPGEDFSAIEQICHLRDIEKDGYHLRIQSMLNEDFPSLLSVDGYGMAIERDYKNNNLAEAIIDFGNERKKTLSLINGIKAEQWERRGNFEGYGEVSLRGLIHCLCSHDFEHLASLSWLLGKIS